MEDIFDTFIWSLLIIMIQKLPVYAKYSVILILLEKRSKLGRRHHCNELQKFMRFSIG
jgi:hypothetical protein